MSKNTTKTISSVEKALNILELISHNDSGLTTTEISNMTNQGVSATFHLLNTLRISGFVRQDEKSKRFFIGYALLRIAHSAKKQFSLSNIADNYLEKLTLNFNETSNLVVLKDTDIEYISQCECNQLLKMFTQIGARIPYNCTGGGKAIAAFLPENEQISLLSRTSFFPYTKNSCSSVLQLKENFDEIRKKGFALDNEEREIGVTCIAAPIFNEADYPIAAVSISGPTSRIKEKGIDILSEAIKKTASEISNKLST